MMSSSFRKVKNDDISFLPDVVIFHFVLPRNSEQSSCELVMGCLEKKKEVRTQSYEIKEMTKK